jgi:hypothetical protein
MSEYLRFRTFRRRQPDVISPIFEKLMQGISEVKGGVKSKVIMVSNHSNTATQQHSNTATQQATTA